LANRLLIVAIVVVCANLMMRAQSSAQIQGPDPKEIVNNLWMKATQGDLITPEGWDETAKYYTQVDPPAERLSFQVMSNDWAVWPARIQSDTAEVDVDYTAEGRIDPSLQYVPPPKIPYIKTGIAYHLKLVSGYNVMYGPDGKTVVNKKPSGTRGWQIEDPRGVPWTTVNTAIRYVLEMRNKTSDQALKKNADETLAKLLQLH
jgi:hypothetical protein